jgi:molybdopterin/thiamine biosynthesis adenylyltransferase
MMDLEDHAYLVSFVGTQQLVIEDGPLLDWAEENGVSPNEAVLEVLDRKIIPLRYLKNFDSLDCTGQRRLCESRVFICGCGGLGGILIELMARSGVGHLRLADADVFAPSNLNRQLLSEFGNISQKKALVAAERARAVNPLIEVEVFPVRVDEGNINVMIEGVDLVLDALDNLAGRFLLAESARRSEIPFIHAAVAGWWGQISTFLPQSVSDLKMIYGNRQMRDSGEDSVGVLGPTAAVIGSMEAMEAIRLLSGKAPAYAEQLLYFDGESGRMEVMPLHPL